MSNDPAGQPVPSRRNCARSCQAAITLDELDEIGNVDLSLAEYYAARVRSVAQATGEGERWIRRWFERKLITESGIR
ncbi:MAG: hypothetical protein ACM3Z4_03595, partial [Hyphomicrobiales bacterium]